MRSFCATRYISITIFIVYTIKLKASSKWSHCHNGISYKSVNQRPFIAFVTQFVMFFNLLLLFVWSRSILAWSDLVFFSDFVTEFKNFLRIWRNGNAHMGCDVMSLYFVASCMELAQKISKGEGFDKYLSCRYDVNILQLMLIKMTPVLDYGSDNRRNTF